MARPCKMTAQERAAVIAYAESSTDAAASKRFRVSARTLQRWRSEIRRGESPEVAASVAEMKSATLNEHTELLDRVWLQALTAMSVRLDDPKEKLSSVCEAVSILGTAIMTRDMLREDDNENEPNRGPRSSEANAGDKGRAAGSEASPSGASPAVH